MQNYDLWIDGRLTPAAGERTFDCVNPSTGEVFARTADASLADMQAAVTAARQAFDDGRWSGLTIRERGRYLQTIARLIREHAQELAELECRDGGKTLKQATFIDVPTCADTFEAFGQVSDQLQGRVNPVPAPVQSLTAREPLGVVGCIVPWNYPLIMLGWKAAPALIAGNTVVFKPSSTAGAAVMRLAEILAAAGLPPGVLNIVASTDHAVAGELARSPLVDMLSFTGGTETGRAIMRQAADTTKKVSLELGGKSPNIVFADCDLETAVGGTMAAIFMNQGQMCTAGSRLILQDTIYDSFLERLLTRTRGLRIGNSLDYQTDFGPLVSRAHRDRVLEFIAGGIQDGATLLCGGRIPAGLDASIQGGSYLEPTIFGDVKKGMAIFDEEIFGPVLCVTRFSDVEQALRIANDSPYGLASLVWTRDLALAQEVGRRLQCGTVWVNTYGGFYNEASFGGYKQSGFGRTLGPEGLLEYTQTKHICVDQTPGGRPLVAGWF